MDLSNPAMETLAAAGAASADRTGDVAPAAEAIWIERARGGDEAAFGALVDRYRDRAYGLAMRIVRVPAEAEEVAQDAFVRVWRALPGFRGDAAFSTWLYRIVVRRALDRAAVLKTRRQREAEVEMAADLPDERADGSGAEALWRSRRLERLMGGLTEVQRIVVTLYYYEDRSVEDVSEVLGMPENTVKTHLRRAREALRSAWLRDQGAP